MSGQSLNHTAPGQASHKPVYQYQVPILLPVNDNLLLNQQKRDSFFPRKNVPDARVNLRSAAYDGWVLVSFTS